MITEEDRTYLEDIAGKKGAGAQRMRMGFVIFAVCMSIEKLYFASIFADMDGTTLHDVLVRSANGPSVRESYTGSFIRAADSIQMSMLYIGMALLFSVGWWKARQSRERTQRVLNSLKRSGVIR